LLTSIVALIDFCAYIFNVCHRQYVYSAFPANARGYAMKIVLQQSRVAGD